MYSGIVKPIVYNFHKRISCSIVSKTFRKSVSIMAIIKPFSKPFRILSFKKEGQEPLQKYCENHSNNYVVNF